jgi:hypothetical protein
VVSLALAQRATCKRIGARFIPALPTDKLGIAIATLQLKPLNALRHAPESATCGWYVWGGKEFDDPPDFFQPLHVAHIGEYCPALLPYLGLAPGWRVLLADGYEDVWFDPNLLRDQEESHLP